MFKPLGPQDMLALMRRLPGAGPVTASKLKHITETAHVEVHYGPPQSRGGPDSTYYLGLIRNPVPSNQR